MNPLPPLLYVGLTFYLLNQIPSNTLSKSFSAQFQSYELTFHLLYLILPIPWTRFLFLHLLPNLRTNFPFFEPTFYPSCVESTSYFLLENSIFVEIAVKPQFSAFIILYSCSAHRTLQNDTLLTSNGSNGFQQTDRDARTIWNRYSGERLDETTLMKFLTAKLGLHGETITLRKFRHGQSNPTYYTKFGGKELVLRKKPVSRLRLLRIFWL